MSTRAHALDGTTFDVEAVQSRGVAVVRLRVRHGAHAAVTFRFRPDDAQALREGLEVAEAEARAQRLAARTRASNPPPETRTP